MACTEGSWEVFENHFRVPDPVKVLAGLEKGRVRSGRRAVGMGCGLGGAASAHRLGRERSVVSDLFPGSSRTERGFGIGHVLSLPEGFHSQSVTT